MDKLSTSIVLLILLEQCASQAPSLRKSLSSSYTIDLSVSPYFPFCKFSGYPTPEVFWSFNGQRLPMGTDDSQGGPYYIPDSGVLVLSGGSSGTYTCTGTNLLGTKSIDITIEIFTRKPMSWYLRPYIWFVFAGALWVLCVIMMLVLFVYKWKKRKAYTRVVDCSVGYNAFSEEVRIGGRPDIPISWDPMSPKDMVLCIDLQPAAGGSEYQKVLTAFNKTMTKGRDYTTIIKIQRVQNPGLYAQYKMKERQMIDQNPTDCQNERQLFHGTDSESATKINTNGFNRSYAGKHAKYYGMGTYFARDASYSAHPTYSKPDRNGHKYIYLARVLVGEYTVGNSDMTVPPPKNPQLDSTVLFDSLVDDKQDPSIFVIGRDAQSYPEYLIIFK